MYLALIMCNYIDPLLINCLLKHSTMREGVENISSHREVKVFKLSIIY